MNANRNIQSLGTGIVKYALLAYLILSAYYTAFGNEKGIAGVIVGNEPVPGTTSLPATTGSAELTAKQETAPVDEPTGGDKQLLDFSGFCHGETVTDQLANDGIEIMVKTNDGMAEVPVVVNANICLSEARNPDNIKDVLVIPQSLTDNDQDGILEDPCANETGGKLFFIFGENKSIGSFLFIGNEPDAKGTATAYDAYGNVVKFVTITGEETGVTEVHMDVDEARILCIEYSSSGAIADIELSCSQEFCYKTTSSKCPVEEAPDGTKKD